MRFDQGAIIPVVRGVAGNLPPWYAAAAARAPADFAPKTGTVRFRPGELSTSLTLDVVGDLSPERNEGFEVRFSAPAGGAAIGDAAARVTIVDDD